MEKIITVGIILDAQTYKKVKEFAVKKDVAQSEIVRVLLNKSPLKINTRDNKAIQHDAKEKGKVNDKPVQLYLTKELKDKIKKMSLENSTSFSEIIRHLISTADFNKFTFKTKGENILKAKAKLHK